MNLSPSPTTRSEARATVPSGGIGGSRSAAYSAGREQQRVDAVGELEAVRQLQQQAGDQRAADLTEVRRP